jgi:hypothetical protein
VNWKKYIKLIKLGTKKHSNGFNIINNNIFQNKWINKENNNGNNTSNSIYNITQAKTL